jgi:hypothetical protein
MGATTTEVPTNHVAMVSHPEEVVTMIETAAAAVPVALFGEPPLSGTVSSRAAGGPSTGLSSPTTRGEAGSGMGYKAGPHL